MILGDELGRVIKNLKQEVLNLKQVKHASCASKYYLYEFDGGGEYYQYYKITYAEGDQPIISEVLTYSSTALSTPANNVQYAVNYGYGASAFTLLSTREVLSIEGIAQA